MSEKSFHHFSDLDIPEPLSRALRKMKFIEPTPIQGLAIPPGLKGKDILGIAQTGTGKTGAFGIPLLTTLYHDPQIIALVLAPTRELAAQIHKVMRQMTEGMKMYGTLLVGGESFRNQKDELDEGVDYIIATPGRLIDHLQRKTVRLDRVGILVLDEVDRMLDMGFLPQVRTIMRHIPEHRQTLIFSATLPDEITKLANSYLQDPVRITIEGSSKPGEQIKQETIETTHAQKTDLLLKELKEREGRVLVFTRTKERAERIATIVERAGIDVVLLHGGRSQGQRKQALEGFRRGRPRIMVATDLAGRGIDIPDIEHVINYDLPGTREDYIHRIGRTGRWGKTGIAVTFVTPEDVGSKSIVSGIKPPSRVVFSSSRRRRR
jgi:superfamily II DNA/RNA helicase